MVLWGTYFQQCSQKPKLNPKIKFCSLNLGNLTLYSVHKLYYNRRTSCSKVQPLIFQLNKFCILLLIMFWWHWNASMLLTCLLVLDYQWCLHKSDADTVKTQHWIQFWSLISALQIYSAQKPKIHFFFSIILSCITAWLIHELIIIHFVQSNIFASLMLILVNCRCY